MTNYEIINSFSFNYIVRDIRNIRGSDTGLLTGSPVMNKTPYIAIKTSCGPFCFDLKYCIVNENESNISLSCTESFSASELLDYLYTLATSFDLDPESLRKEFFSTLSASIINIVKRKADTAVLKPNNFLMRTTKVNEIACLHSPTESTELRVGKGSLWVKGRRGEEVEVQEVVEPHICDSQYVSELRYLNSQLEIEYVYARYDPWLAYTLYNCYKKPGRELHTVNRLDAPYHKQHREKNPHFGTVFAIPLGRNPQMSEVAYCVYKNNDKTKKRILFDSN